MNAKMTEAQRKIINQSIDDMVRNHREHADTLTAAPRGDVRRRMADAGWLFHEGLTAPLTRKAFEDAGRLADYPEANPEANPETATSGSAVVATLEKVWEKIREDTPELPAVVIVTGSGMIGQPRWGHFRADGWMERAEEGAATNLTIGEMFVAGETLARGAAHTLETMLHEAAHVLAKVRGVKDTSRQGRWHNQKFRGMAEEMGLEYAGNSAHPQHGFSQVTFTPGTQEQYAEVITELDRAIRLTVDLPLFLRPVAGKDGQSVSVGAGESMGHHGGRKPRAEGSGPSTNNVKATCACEEPRIIRVSRRVLDGPDILCGECGEDFRDRS